MTVFWIVAAMFVAGALLIVLPALWRPGGTATASAAALAVHRDQWTEAEHDVAAGRLASTDLAEARAEIERRAGEDAQPGDAALAAQAPISPRRLAMGLALLVAAASIALYLALGHPASIAPAEDALASHSAGPEQAQRMVALLLDRVKARPDDIEGWTQLGRGYIALQRWRDGAIALRRAVDLAPNNPHLLADLADVVAMNQGRRLAGEPTRLIQQALDADPRHVKALALAGSAALEAQDYAAARDHWQRALALVPPDSPAARSMRGSLAQATKLADGATTTAANAATRIDGEVLLSPALASRMGPNDTLFVFARAAEGPRMPLAIVRRSAALPASFALDDSMAMSPQLRLSAFARVVVGARLSRSGNATPQPGDLIGQSEPVAPGAAGLRIVIDRVQP
jgi:cytochrome c-type biogenesis protein CcmH